MSSELHRHWTLDPDIAFLNHGSFGAAPRAVLEAQQELRDRLEREPIRFFLRDFQELWDTALRRGADFVGADPTGFAFVNNASTGVNTVLRSLNFEPGDELVVTDHEYNACRNALDFVAQRSGATIRVATLPYPIEDPSQAIDAIAEQLTDETRLVLVDHVTSKTALVMPVAEIVRVCHARGIEVLIDGAHAPGMIDLDVAAIGADYYTGNFHKWVCTPKAAAFLSVSEEKIPQIRPLVISHGANSAAKDEADRFYNEFWWQGTADPTPVFTIPVGIDHMASLVDGGWPEIRRRNRSLALEARALLNEHLGETPLAPDVMIGSIATVRIPDGDGPAPTSALDIDPDQTTLYFEHGVEVPLTPWPKWPHRVLRVSAQLYNSIEDYERLVDAMGQMWR